MNASPGALEVSLLIPCKSSGHALRGTVRQAHAYLTRHYPGSFELILIPNPGPGNSDDSSTDIALALEGELPGVRCVPHLGPSGKGAALRTGFFASRGRRIFFTAMPADQTHQALRDNAFQRR